ncbi:MAG: hypothetical protein ACRC6X_06450 [Culicoidibacterales bacterium]
MNNKLTKIAKLMLTVAIIGSATVIPVLSTLLNFLGILSIVQVVIIIFLLKEMTGTKIAKKGMIFLLVGSVLSILLNIFIVYQRLNLFITQGRINDFVILIRSLEGIVWVVLLAGTIMIYRERNRVIELIQQENETQMMPVQQADKPIN